MMPGTSSLEDVQETTVIFYLLGTHPVTERPILGYGVSPRVPKFGTFTTPDGFKALSAMDIYRYVRDEVKLWHIGDSALQPRAAGPVGPIAPVTMTGERSGVGVLAPA